LLLLTKFVGFMTIELYSRQQHILEHIQLVYYTHSYKKANWVED